MALKKNRWPLIKKPPFAKPSASPSLIYDYQLQLHNSSFHFLFIIAAKMNCWISPNQTVLVSWL